MILLSGKEGIICLGLFKAQLNQSGRKLGKPLASRATISAAMTSCHLGS